MVQATYRAPEGDDLVVQMRGVRFYDGQPVELDPVEHLSLIAKLVGNQHFEINDYTPPPSVDEENAGLKALHVGGRFFAIFDSGKKIRDGLSKSDAEAFNALSDDEKIEYLA